MGFVSEGYKMALKYLISWLIWPMPFLSIQKLCRYAARLKILG